MATESCYMCEKPLENYFALLCPECRAKCEAEEHDGQDEAKGRE